MLTSAAAADNMNSGDLLGSANDEDDDFGDLEKPPQIKAVKT